MHCNLTPSRQQPFRGHSCHNSLEWFAAKVICGVLFVCVIGQIAMLEISRLASCHHVPLTAVNPACLHHNRVPDLLLSSCWEPLVSYPQSRCAITLTILASRVCAVADKLCRCCDGQHLSSLAFSIDVQDPMMGGLVGLQACWLTCASPGSSGSHPFVVRLYVLCAPMVQDLLWSRPVFVLLSSLRTVQLS